MERLSFHRDSSFPKPRALRASRPRLTPYDRRSHAGDQTVTSLRRDTHPVKPSAPRCDRRPRELALFSQRPHQLHPP